MKKFLAMTFLVAVFGLTQMVFAADKSAKSDAVMNDGGKYGKYFVQKLQDPKTGNPEFQAMYKKFSHRILWLDKNVVPNSKFQMNVAWYYAVPEKHPVFPEHAHNSNEIVGFIGSDPKDPENLGGEIEVTYKGEKHILTKSTIIYIPANVKHMPLNIVRVDRPIFHFSLVDSGEYGKGGAYQDK